MVEVGLIGCGAVVHANYAATLRGRANYRVSHVCDLDQAQAQSAADLFGAKVVSLQEISELAEAIVISTPPSTHAALVSQVVRPDRTILCEKPFMTSSADARHAVAIAEDAGCHLYVGHFRRAYPHVDLAQRLIALGLIGKVHSITALEGGRFTWHAVSGYTTESPQGGVLWDTGSHTLDTALFVAGLDDSPLHDIGSVQVTRDKPEPSHSFGADCNLEYDDGSVALKLRLSRKDVLPNILKIQGASGELLLSAGLDDRIRIRTEKGTEVLEAGNTMSEVLEAFDLQLQRILTGRDGKAFSAHRFVGLTQILETLGEA